MRHRVNTVKLNRTSSHRKAMFRNMVTSLFKHDRIRTTDAKAKELRRWADHLITLAKRGDLHARRQALAIIREKTVVHRLFAEAEDRFGSVSGGYTRIIKIGKRPGDAALISLIELVSKGDEKPVKEKKKKTASTETTTDVTADSVKEDLSIDETESSSDDEAAVEAATATDETPEGDLPADVGADAEEADRSLDTPAEAEKTDEELEADSNKKEE